MASARAIADFHETYGDLQARLVQAKSGTPWLGGRRAGYAVESAAPPKLMTLSSGRWSSLWSPLGTIQVRPLGPPLPLGTLPLGNVREAIRAGVAITASTDAHSTRGLGNMELAVATARRGWATPEDVLNTRPLAELAELRRRKLAR